MGRPKGSKNKIQKVKNNYFDETYMTQKLIEYKKYENVNAFYDIEKGMQNIINGMINKQFSFNTYIKTNKNDAISECVYEIIKSLQRYNPDKGRLFAYINRIAKNTLLKYQKKIRKIKEHEYSYIDFAYEDIDTTDNVVDNILEKQIGMPVNAKVMSVDSSIYIIYRYFKHVSESIIYYLNNDTELDILLNTLKYDHNVNFSFEFENTSDKNIVKHHYIQLLNDINITLNNINNWLQTTYPEQIQTEPEYNNMSLSPRAIGYIKKYINTNLEKYEYIKNFNISNLIELINYIVYQKGIVNE